MQGMKMEAKIIYESHLPDALRRALIYAGDDGFVASMPQLLRARVGAPYDNIIWNTWFTANSEECVATTPRGNRVVVAVHGGGIFSTPERFLRLYHSSVDRSSELGFTGIFAAKISDEEARGIVEGKLPDATQIPVYPFDEFRRGIADTPRRYAVIMDFETAKISKCGYTAFDDLKDDPMMIIRAGGAEQAAAYLDKAKKRGNADTIGSWHTFNEMLPHQAQCCVCLMYGGPGGVRARKIAELGIDQLRGAESDFGLRGDTGMINMGRYVAVAPRSVSTSVRHLPFSD